MGTTMFWNIALHEFRYRFRLVSTWVYIFMFFGAGFLVSSMEGGAFDGVTMQGGKGGEFAFANSPINITLYTGLLLYICTIVFAAIFGSSAVRDFETGSHELFFTKPIKPVSYHMGKFTGAFLSAVTIVVAIIMGLAIGFQMPFLADYKIGPHLPMAYIHAFLYIGLPNLFLVGAICFNVGLLSRKIINSYVLGIGLFFAYILASVFMGDIEKLHSAALLDPFGMNTIDVITRYWTTTQSNTNMVNLGGLLGWNRLIWFGVALLISAYAIFRFEFCKEPKTGKIAKAAKKTAPPAETQANYFTKVRPEAYKSWKQFWHMLAYEVKNLIFNRTFLVVSCFFCFYLIVTAIEGVGKMFGTQTYPITNQVLAVLSYSFYLFGLILATFYAGDLLWHDRTQKMDQLCDVTPHHSSLRYFSKLGAILTMQLVLMGIIMLVGIILQIAKGFYQLEPGLYLFRLFVFDFLDLLPITLMVFFWGMVMNNRYAGYLAMILFYISTPVLLMFHIDHPLLRFGIGGIQYSDMNGYGGMTPRFFGWAAYWILFSAGLNILGFKLWNRGTETSYKAKWQRIRKQGFDLGFKMALGTFICFILMGGMIYYDQNILNEYTSVKKQRREQVEYENKYRDRLMALAQPRISEVDLKIDFHPSRRSMHASGSFQLVNRTLQPIDTLVVYFDDDFEDRILEFDKPVNLVESHHPTSLFIYSLPLSLAPLDSMQLSFAFSEKPKGIFPFIGHSSIKKNGTFIYSSYLPSLGYNDGFEMKDNNDRSKKGLPPKLRMPAISDSSQYGNPYLSTDSDYVRYKVEISTEDDQIAFAPGDLLDSKTEAGRYIAHYGSRVPILNFFAFISGRFEKAEARYQDKLVEVYYDKKHPYNVQTMLESAVQSLKYFGENFMPYPYQALRIVEVPYVNFAQSFPALIPFSENIGFIAKVDPDDMSSVDYPYQVVSHEIGHQWWAHTVIGANVQGATMLSEVFTEYSSMMVLKQKYGEERMRKYLSYIHDNYLQGRGLEFREEQPLYLNEGQGYLHYYKGTLAMLALQDYIGEAAVNEALGAFCRDYAYHSEPFPLSTDALPYIRRVVPDSLQYLVTDLLETITLFDNKIVSAKQSYDESRKEYRVTVTFSTQKFRATGFGEEESIPMNDLLDIALYDDKEEVAFARARFKAIGGEQTVTLTSKNKPGKVVLDPLFKMIDKDRKNNSLSPT